MAATSNDIFPQMPMATAVWLVDNTALTFEQIAVFTGLHEIQVQAIADEEVAKGMKGENPLSEQAKVRLTAEEIARCEKDSSARLKPMRLDLPPVKARSKGPKYTPVARRGDKPDAIAWLIKHHPEISDAQLCTLVGTTKPTIDAVRNRTHPTSQTLKPRHPAELGLCTYAELEAASRKGYKAMGKDPDQIAAEKAQEAQEREDGEAANRREKFEFANIDFSNFLGKTSTSSDDNG